MVVAEGWQGVFIGEVCMANGTNDNETMHVVLITGFLRVTFLCGHLRCYSVSMDNCGSWLLLKLDKDD